MFFTLYELSKNIEISRQTYRCIVSTNAADKMSERVCVQVSVPANRPDLEQNGSRVFRANLAKFIASSCFRTVDPRYARSSYLAANRTFRNYANHFSRRYHLGLFDDSISEVSTVKPHRSVEQRSNIAPLSVAIFIRKRSGFNLERRHVRDPRLPIVKFARREPSP